MGKCLHRRDEIVQPEEMETNIEIMPLRMDLNDSHYSQLFFVVGHLAIKMLTYVE